MEVIPRPHICHRYHRLYPLRNLGCFCSKFVWWKISVEKKWQIWGLVILRPRPTAHQTAYAALSLHGLWSKKAEKMYFYTFNWHEIYSAHCTCLEVVHFGHKRLSQGRVRHVGKVDEQGTHAFKLAQSETWAPCSWLRVYLLGQLWSSHKFWRAAR